MGHCLYRIWKSEAGKRIARDRAQQIGRGVLVGGQVGQRAVEVDVGGVDEFHDLIQCWANHWRAARVLR